MDTPIHDSLLAEFRAKRETPKTTPPTHICLACGRWQVILPGTDGIAGGLCMVCYYDL